MNHTIVRDTSPSTVREWLKNENVLFIDVREEWEYQLGNIDGAINIPLSEIDDLALKETMESRSVKYKYIVFYCRSGKRSASAIKMLEDQASNFWNLEGGILKWRATE